MGRERLAKKSRAARAEPARTSPKAKAKAGSGKARGKVVQMDLFREETAQAGPAKTSARRAKSRASGSKPAAKEIPAPDAEVAQPVPAVAASKTPAAPPARRRQTAETM